MVNTGQVLDSSKSPAPAARGRLTPEQGIAVEQRQVSIVLSSGAGCGKTHVLTERYLSHLREDGAEVSQIVALTFTERAARQMRERIRGALLQALHSESTEQGQAVWQKHLRGLESAQITTIHAFCSSLLRQYSVEAGLDPGFDVLEAVLTASFQARARLDCLQELLLTKEPIGQDLHTLVVLYGWPQVVEGVRLLTQQPNLTAWAEWLAKPVEAILADWVGPSRQALLTDWVQYLTTASPKIARALYLMRTTPAKSPAMKAQIARLLAETPLLAQAKELGQTIEELTELAKVGKERAKAWHSESDYETIKLAFEEFREELPKQLNVFVEPTDTLVSALESAQSYLKLAQKVTLEYQERKHRAGVLDFDDLLMLTRDLLRTQSDIRAQLQRRYKHVLVDELQDTDPVQMELVQLLCGGELTAGKLFAVGDYKQSIYRFRGADVAQFEELRRSMPHEGRLGLSVNFRSQPAILHFANALFAQHLPSYEPLVPHHPQLGEHECVEFLWTPKEAKEPISVVRSREADWLARRIVALLEQQTPLVTERGTAQQLRRARPGDIVLLFRSMSNVHLYEAALRKHGLSYYLVGGRAFFAQQEIYDILNLLRTLENPLDTLSLTGTLRSPFCCLSDETLFMLSRHAAGMWSGLLAEEIESRLPAAEVAAVRLARAGLTRWRSLKDRVPLVDLLQTVLADTGYDAALQFEFLGERKLANLWKLLELARTFDRSGLFSLADFIDRLGELVRTQPREEQAATQPENADVVRLMTIHQAKGLEFPIVFLPDLSANTRGSQHPAVTWDAKMGCVVKPPSDEPDPPFTDIAHRQWRVAETLADWQEELRTFYVACTRAQDCLVLSASMTRPFSPANTCLFTLAERFSLTTGACLAEAIPPDLQPKVRVTASEVHLAPNLESDRPTHRGRAEQSTIVPRDWPKPVQPIATQCSQKHEFTLAELCAESSTDTGLSTEDLAWQFDAEDGSDRTQWSSLREQRTSRGLLENSLGSRLFREVLWRWDWRDPEGWDRTLKTLLLREGTSSKLVAVAEQLARLAQSELRVQLASAQEIRWEQPFSQQLSETALVHDLLDCVWRDTENRWHLLEFVLPDERAKQPWLSQSQAKLLLAGQAFRGQFQAQPHSLCQYDVETGLCHSCVQSESGLAHLLDTLRARAERLQRTQLSTETTLRSSAQGVGIK